MSSRWLVFPEFDVCHKFVQEKVKFIFPSEAQKFVRVTHVIGSNDFSKVIFCGKRNFPYEKRGVGELRKLCRYYFGNFYSLTIMLKSLAATEEEKQNRKSIYRNTKTMERVHISMKRSEYEKQN